MKSERGKEREIVPKERVGEREGRESRHRELKEIREIECDVWT